jgi:hypothetical protein
MTQASLHAEVDQYATHTFGLPVLRIKYSVCIPTGGAFVADLADFLWDFSSDFSKESFHQPRH